MTKEEIKKQMQELEKQLAEIEEQEKENTKFGVEDIAKGFKKALEDGEVDVYDFTDEEEIEISEQVNKYFNFEIKDKDFNSKEIIIERDSENGNIVLVGVFYKKELIFGIEYNDHEYSDDFGTFVSKEETEEIYKRTLWNI